MRILMRAVGMLVLLLIAFAFTLTWCVTWIPVFLLFGFHGIERMWDWFEVVLGVAMGPFDEAMS